MAMYDELQCGLDSHPNSNPPSFDERSPLLTEPIGNVPAYPVSGDQVVEESIDKRKSTSKLVYIMIGLWLGTFCAVLGKPPNMDFNPLLFVAGFGHNPNKEQLLDGTNRGHLGGSCYHRLPVLAFARVACDGLLDSIGSNSAPVWKVDRYLLTPDGAAGGPNPFLYKKLDLRICITVVDYDCWTSPGRIRRGRL